MSEKPACLVFVAPALQNGMQVHQYHVPESGPDIVHAITWMLTEYADVRFEYGEAWGTPYAYLEGYVKPENRS